MTLGYLARDGAGRGYALGLRNLELGRIVGRSFDVVELCRPALIRLCRQSKETVNLAVPYLDNALIVESYEGSHGVRATSYAGTRAYYHSTACGKAMLARMAPAVRQQLYEAVGLPPMTPNTITTVDALEANMALVLETGFAVEVEENEIGASCVGVAIVDAMAQPVASFSVAGIVQRMNAAMVQSISGLLMTEVAALQRQLTRARR